MVTGDCKSTFEHSLKFVAINLQALEFLVGIHRLNGSEKSDSSQEAPDEHTTTIPSNKSVNYHAEQSCELGKKMDR